MKPCSCPDCKATGKQWPLSAFGTHTNKHGRKARASRTIECRNRLARMSYWNRMGETKKEEQYNLYRSKDKSTECKCPLCEVKHPVLMHWVGRGVPRVYCEPCKKQMANQIDMTMME